MTSAQTLEHLLSIEKNKNGILLDIVQGHDETIAELRGHLDKIYRAVIGSDRDERDDYYSCVDHVLDDIRKLQGEVEMLRQRQSGI